MYKNYQNVKGNQWHNPDISAEIKRLNITDIIQRAGFRVKNGFCSCPFHEEKTASMKIYQNTSSFNCFGCGTGGDAVTFIRKYYGVEFSEALKIAGINQSGPYLPTPEDTERQKIQELRQAYERWKINYSTALGHLVFDARAEIKQVKGRRDLNGITEILQNKETWAYHLSILQSGDENLCLDLYADMEVR